MYSVWGLVAGIFFVWAAILTFFVWRQEGFLKSLFPKSGERDIRKRFDEVFKMVEEYGQDLDKFKRKLVEVEKLDLSHIQRVKLLRYNPYGDTGGDQSFTLAMLDDKGNGFVLSSLHNRSVTRIFAKPVEDGKPGKHEFSEEEKKIIAEAMKD